MKSLIILALLAALGVAAVPAAASEGLGRCTTSHPTVALGGLQEEMEETPRFPGDVTTVTYVLSLAGQPEGSTALVDVAVSWDDPVSDFDVAANGQSAPGLTILSGPQEIVPLGALGHCTPITVSVENVSGSPLANLTLGINARQDTTGGASEPRGPVDVVVV